MKLTKAQRALFDKMTGEWVRPRDIGIGNKEFVLDRMVNAGFLERRKYGFRSYEYRRKPEPPK